MVVDRVFRGSERLALRLEHQASRCTGGRDELHGAAGMSIDEHRLAACIAAVVAFCTILAWYLGGQP